MKNFVKAIDREGHGFAFLQEKFPQISTEKLKAGIFEDSQVREHLKDPMFGEAVNEAELPPPHWQSLESEVINFMVNRLSVEYEKEIEELLKCFRNSGYECQSNYTF